MAAWSFFSIELILWVNSSVRAVKSCISLSRDDSDCCSWLQETNYAKKYHFSDRWCWRVQGCHLSVCWSSELKSQTSDLSWYNSNCWSCTKTGNQPSACIESLWSGSSTKCNHADTQSCKHTDQKDHFTAFTHLNYFSIICIGIKRRYFKDYLLKTVYCYSLYCILKSYIMYSSIQNYPFPFCTQVGHHV